MPLQLQYNTYFLSVAKQEHATTMILVRARFKSQMADITYDPASDGGVDVLELLVASMFDQLSEPVLIDFAGRRISALEDLEDVKVVELIPESLQSSVEDVLGHRETAGWDHHEHLLNATKEIDTKGALMRGTTVVNIWVLDKVDLSLHRYCTSTVFAPSAPAAATDTSADNTCILQPVHRIIDTTLLLCTRCAQMVSQDIMQKGSEKLIKFNCSGKQVLDIGLGKFQNTVLSISNGFSLL